MPSLVMMPQLGDAILEGRVVRWLHQEGDIVKENEPLVEIDIAQVGTEIPSPSSGMLMRILNPTGNSVMPGDVLAWIVQPDEATTNNNSQEKDMSSSNPNKVTNPYISPVVARLAEENGVDLTQVQGNGESGRITKEDVLKYLEEHRSETVQVVSSEMTADTFPELPFAPPERLAEVQIEQGVLQEPPPAALSYTPLDETATQKYAHENTSLSFDAKTTPLSKTPVEVEEFFAPQPAPAPLEAVPAPESSSDPTPPEAEEETPAPFQVSEPVKDDAPFQPDISVQRMDDPPTEASAEAESSPIPPASIAIDPPLAEEEVSPALPSDTLHPISSARRSAAETLALSKQNLPEITIVMEADLSLVTAHREANESFFMRDGAHLTYTAYFISAVTAALKENPKLNSNWSERGVYVHSAIHIGLSVSLGEEGIIMPVIKNADNLSLLGLAREWEELKTRALRHQLGADEMEEATFSIINHGQNGAMFSTAIIPPRQSAVLSIGAVKKRTRIIDDAIAIRPMVYLCLTFDRRVADELTADNFLGRVVNLLENWA